MSGNQRVLFCIMLLFGLFIHPLFLTIAAVIYLAPLEDHLIPRDEEGKRCCPVCKTRHYLVFPTRQRTFSSFSGIFSFGKTQVEYRCQNCTKSWRESGED